MDKIFLKNLRLKTRIGLFDWEKQIDQIINIDLEAGFDILKAAKTDDVKHSLDYKTISNIHPDFHVGLERYWSLSPVIKCCFHIF